MNFKNRRNPAILYTVGAMPAERKHFSPLQNISNRWDGWWRRQSPSRQDRFALLGPLVSVVLFLAAITTAFGYLRYEEIEREQESVRRDLEYAQQRLRLRLLERQEQIMRIARDVADREMGLEEFISESEALVSQYPELSSITWVDAKRRVRASSAGLGVQGAQMRNAGELLRHPESENTFTLAREVQQSVYSQPIFRNLPGRPTLTQLQLQIPLLWHGKFEGVIMAEYAIDGLLRFVVPAEITGRHAVSFVDASNALLAGQSMQPRSRIGASMPWMAQAYEYSVPVSPVGNSLQLRAQAY